jgi:hypothetical protein
MTRALRAAVLAVLVGSTVGAADRNWREGTWVEVKVARPRIVIGVRPKPSPEHPPTMVEIRTYVITTEDLRLEVREPSPPPRRSVVAVVGQSVTLALERNTVYVREDDGTELRLQLTKKEERRRRLP